MWSGIVDPRTHHSHISLEELILASGHEFQWIPASEPCWLCLWTPQSGRHHELPRSMAASQGMRALVVSPEPVPGGESWLHRAILIYFFGARLLSLSSECRWLHPGSLLSLPCSLYFSWTAAAASPQHWSETPGYSWTSPKGRFYTSESGSKYSLLHGR